jgi:hypothetical protein
MIAMNNVTDTTVLMSQTMDALIYPGAQNINQSIPETSSSKVESRGLSYDSGATTEELYAHIHRILNEYGWSVMFDTNYGSGKTLTFYRLGSQSSILQQLFLNVTIGELDSSVSQPDAVRYVGVGLRSIPDQRKLVLPLSADQVKIEETKRKEERPTYSVSFSTTETPQQVRAFYVAALERRGWQVDNDVDQGNPGDLNYYFHERGPLGGALFASLTLSVEAKTGVGSVVRITAVGHDLEFQQMQK